MNLCRSGKGGLSIALEAKECFESVVSCTIFLKNVSSLQKLVIGLLEFVNTKTSRVVKASRSVPNTLARLQRISVAAMLLVSFESSYHDNFCTSTGVFIWW